MPQQGITFTALTRALQHAHTCGELRSVLEEVARNINKPEVNHEWEYDELRDKMSAAESNAHKCAGRRAQRPTRPRALSSAAQLGKHENALLDLAPVHACGKLRRGAAVRFGSGGRSARGASWHLQPPPPPPRTDKHDLPPAMDFWAKHKWGGERDGGIRLGARAGRRDSVPSRDWRFGALWTGMPHGLLPTPLPFRALGLRSIPDWGSRVRAQEIT